MMRALYIMNQDSFDLVYPAEVRSELESLADFYAPVQTAESIRERPELLREAEVIFSGWGGPRLDEAFLARAPRLQALFYAAGSVRQIATAASWEKEIVISSAAAANAVPVAEYTLSQILFCLKHGWQYVRETKKHHSFPPRPYHVPGSYRSTVGLISLSSVGRHVRELLRPFEIDVLVYDPFLTKSEAEQLQVTVASLDDLFAEADVVSMHAPLLEETTGMIRQKHVEAMKPGAAFINTARGAIVNQEEMIEVLRRRADLTAVLDVTSPEPPVRDSPLYTLPNVVLTPHLAGSEGRECGRMGRFMMEEWKRYINNEPLQGNVTRKQFETMA